MWVRDMAAGEKIEFLVEHRGPALRKGDSVPVGGQEGVAAIPLPNLDLLENTRSLRVPAGALEGTDQWLEVRVPMLGAYVVNKAATFMQRGDLRDERNVPKLAKDLLYLRDLMAAGREVVASIEADIAKLSGEDGRTRALVRTGANHLGLALGGALSRRLPEVAEMLLEREPGRSEDEALADVRGHLTDLQEILAEHMEE